MMGMTEPSCCLSVSGRRWLSVGMNFQEGTRAFKKGNEIFSCSTFSLLIANKCVWPKLVVEEKEDPHYYLAHRG